MNIMNVDVVCNQTGEVLKEGVLLANAHIFIAEHEGKVFKDEVETLELDDIDGGGEIEVRTLYVDFPDVDPAGLWRARKKAAAWWKYHA